MQFELALPNIFQEQNWNVNGEDSLLYDFFSCIHFD